jgi:putative ABC transport system substrate-binding protein
MAEAGCLLSYGPNLNLAWRRIAGMAAEILRGTPPQRLPIERPMRFELVLNGGAPAGSDWTCPPAFWPAPRR